MHQIIQHNNYSNNKINSHDQMRKIIVNLGSKKWKNYNNSTWNLNHLQN